MNQIKRSAVSRNCCVLSHWGILSKPPVLRATVSLIPVLQHRGPLGSAPLVVTSGFLWRWFAWQTTRSGQETAAGANTKFTSSTGISDNCSSEPCGLLLPEKNVITDLRYKEDNSASLFLSFFFFFSPTPKGYL